MPRALSLLPASVLLLVFAGFSGRAAAQSPIPNWERWEQTLTTSRDYHLGVGNPYRDLTLKVTYTPIVCTRGLPFCAPYTSYGFWDGGRTFKIRSAFPDGTWSWSVSCQGTSNGLNCSTDPALDSVLDPNQSTTTATGTISVDIWVPPFDPNNPYFRGVPHRGFLRTSVNGHYLTYASSTSKFFWSADTAWLAAITDKTSDARWHTFLNDRVARGFTVVMMAPAPSGDNATTATTVLFEDLGGNCLGNAWPKSCSRWRPAYWQNLDEKIRLANSKGLAVMLVGVMDPQGNAPPPANVKYPRPEDAALFARNLAARLAGSFVIFSPGFDDHLSLTSTLQDWVGCALREAVPNHLVTAHLAGLSAVGDYNLVHKRRWHQFHAFQSGHGGDSADQNPWEDPFEDAVRRARAMPAALYTSTGIGPTPACPNVPAISLPLPAALKPNVNVEAAYDETYSTPTYTVLNQQQVDTPQGVRHTGYNSALNGSFGFTLGVKGIWDWTNISNTTLASEGSRHMDILSDQFRLLPWQGLRGQFTLIKNQKTERWNGEDKPEEDKQVSMATTSDSNFAMLYVPDNSEVKLEASTLICFSCTTSDWTRTWVNPRTGNPPTPQEGTPSCTNLTNDPHGATRRLKRPLCSGDLVGDSGKCDWVIKLQRVRFGNCTAGVAGLEVWPERSEDGQSWRIAGKVVNRANGLEVEPPATAVSDANAERGLLKLPVVAQEAQGGFRVVWEAENDGDFHGIYSQRMTAQGLRLGLEERVNLTLERDQIHPAVAAGPAGGGVVSWTSVDQDGDSGGIFARRIDGGGALVGPEIAVNSTTVGRQDFSKVGMDAQGRFVVAWTSEKQDGDEEGVYLQRFDAAGSPLEPELLVNTTTAGAQFLTDLAVSPLGDFTVTWTSYSVDGKQTQILWRQYDANGSPLGGETWLAQADTLEQPPELPTE